MSRRLFSPANTSFRFAASSFHVSRKGVCFLAESGSGSGSRTKMTTTMDAASMTRPPT